MLDWFAQFVEEASGYGKTAAAFLKKLQERGAENAADFEDCLRESKSKKEKYRDILLDFYEYYERKTGEKIETELRDKIIIDNPVMRRIEIIKYLQNHKKTTAQIADVFLLDDRTIRDDLLALEDGIEIAGTELKIDIAREGWEKYMENSRHPVFLNLDMPGVVAMTAGLLTAAEHEPLYADQFRKVAKEVCSGLTDYSKWRIGKMVENLEEVELYERTLSDSIITMMKSGCTGTIGVHSEGKDYLFSGCVISGYADGYIELNTERGTKRFPVSDIYLCESTLDRESTLI